MRAMFPKRYQRSRAYRPELVLLDVQLGSETSFDILREFSIAPFSIVFTTAHQDFAVDAFKFSAIDYLLKPIGFRELSAAITKAQHATQTEAHTALGALRENLSSDGPQQKLVLKTQDKIHVVDIGQIVRCESDESYTRFFLVSGENIVVSKTLGYYEELLDDHGFFRIHKVPFDQPEACRANT